MAKLKTMKRDYSGRSPLGIFLIEHRVNTLGLSAFELGLEKGISYCTLGTFEKNRKPDEDYIKRLADVYEVPEEKIRELAEKM